MDSPRLPTMAEKVELALLLAKRRCPSYPSLSPDELEQTVDQICQAAISVLDGTGASPKQMLVHWNEDQAAREVLTWFNGELEPAPECWLPLSRRAALLTPRTFTSRVQVKSA